MLCKCHLSYNCKLWMFKWVISITAIRRCNFFNETNCFFLFYWLLLKAADRRTLGQKVCFLVNTCAFLPLHRINAHWPQLSADIFFAGAAQSSSCFGMISDEGSGGAIVMVVVGGEEGRACRYVDRYQSKTIREPKYYKRVQFALTYCSYVHFI